MIRESGLYSVSVTNAAGCIGISNNVSITVLEAPEPHIEGPISVCRDAIASYRVTGSGVTTSYWSISGGVFRSDPDSSAIEVKWGSAGIAILAVQVDNGLCTAYDTLRVTIGDSLKPVIRAMGPLAFCPGGEVQLDAGDGFDSYTWYTPNGIVMGRTITARTAGTYRVRVTTASACAGTSDPILVTFIDGPSPQIVGPDLICPGDTAILEASPGFASYTWSDGTTGRFCPVIGPATRSVSVVDSNGCIGTSEIHVVASLEVPARPSISRTGDILVSSPAAAYQWYRNDTLLVGETLQECGILFPGRYSVRITNAQGCPAISDTLFVGCAQGSSVVALPHLLVNPGETIVIDPTLQDNTCLEELATRDFIATIRFDKTLLVPLDDTPCGSIDGHDRVIEFTGSLQDLRTSALNLRFLVTLGDRDSIPLILEKFEWLDKPVTVTRIDGSLRLRICREGGDRLFDAEGQVRLAQNRPNPFNSVTIIDYEVIESAMTELFVMNSLGQRVRTLVQDHRTAGRYAVSFDAAELPSGSYILVLRTPTSVLHRAMSLVK